MATPPDFSVGQVLTAAHMNAVGRWKVSSGTITNVGTGGTFAQDVFSADYTIHELFFYNIVSSTANGLLFQFANGTTQSAVNYYAAGQYVLWATGGGANSFVNNGSSWTICSPSTTPRSSAKMTLINTRQSLSTTALIQKQNWDAGENQNGYHAPATAYSGFRVLTTAGTTSFDWICYGSTE